MSWETEINTGQRGGDKNAAEQLVYQQSYEDSAAALRIKPRKENVSHSNRCDSTHLNSCQPFISVSTEAKGRLEGEQTNGENKIVLITSPFPWCKGDPVCHLPPQGWGFVGSGHLWPALPAGICCSSIAMETAAAAASPLRICCPRFQELFWKHLPQQPANLPSFVIILSAWFSALASFPKWTLLPDALGSVGTCERPQPCLGGDEKTMVSRGYPGKHCSLQTGPVSCPWPWEGPQADWSGPPWSPEPFESRPIEAKNNWTNSLSG